MSQSKISIALGGASALIRQLALADPATHARVAEVIKRDTNIVTNAARSNAPRVTGEMASTIRADFSSDGLTGYVKVGIGKLKRRSQSTGKRQRVRRATTGPGAYAPVVEHGDPRRHHKAHPFLDTAYQPRKPQIIEDINGAIDGVLEDIAK